MPGAMSTYMHGCTKLTVEISDEIYKLKDCTDKYKYTFHERLQRVETHTFDIDTFNTFANTFIRMIRDSYDKDRRTGETPILSEEMSKELDYYRENVKQLNSDIASIEDSYEDLDREGIPEFDAIYYKKSLHKSVAKLNIAITYYQDFIEKGFNECRYKGRPLFKKKKEKENS